MRKLFLVVLCFVLMAGCKHAQPTVESSVQPTQETQAVTPPSAQTDTPLSSNPQPRSSVSTPKIPVETTPNASLKAENPLPSQTQTEQNSSPLLPPADQIAFLRQHKTLSSPAADTPSFAKEETIPLDGRHLTPLAYEPVTQTKTHAPWSQEELKYGIYYSFIKAGTAYIKNRGLTTVNGRLAYLIQTTAFSAAAIDAVFKVRDINYSWIDAQTFYSLGYMQSLREGNYVRDEWIIFDAPNRRYYGEVKKKAEPRLIEGTLSGEVLDMLSSLYFVRAQKLEVGKDITLDLVNREEQYPMAVKVLGKETVKTSAGKFRCIVVEPQFRGEGIFVTKGKSLKVWLTDDKYKMPVKMQTEVFIGSVSAELLEYKRN